MPKRKPLFRYRTQREALRVGLGVTIAEWGCVLNAAKDAHMDPLVYCKAMVLCAAGMGGVLEHLERASEASALVDKGGA